MEFLVSILALLLCIEVFEFWDRDENSTNPPHVKKHWWNWTKPKSGLKVYTDHETGVQYIKSSFFDNLQVRLDKNGNPYKSK